MLQYASMLLSLAYYVNFLFVLKTEDIHGRISIGDREFLINPRLGSAIKQYQAEVQSFVQLKASIKKPFDWMSDEQYQHLLVPILLFVFYIAYIE